MVSAIITMAGRGTRMNLEENKVLLKLKNEYIFLISAKKFAKYCDKVILVVNKDDYEFVKQVAPNYQTVIGGSTRQESVFNGLKEVNTKFTLIHDGARPLIDEKTIVKCIESLDDQCAVMTGNKVTDTIRMVENNKSKTLDRSILYRAATPQGGLTSTLLDCHQQAFADNFNSTDDIALIEKYTNLDIKMVESNIENFKLTTLLDLKISREMLGDNDD